MKHAFLAMGLLLVLTTLNPAAAQIDRQADQYFSAEQYHKASLLYQQAFNRDSTDYRVAYRMAECYRHMFDYQKALRYYELVQDQGARNFPLSVFYYALMLKYTQEYEKAVGQFNRFIKQHDRADLSRFILQAEKEKKGCYLAIMEQETGRAFTFYHLEGNVNTDYNEFAPAILIEDSVVFVTSSSIKSVKGTVSNRMGESFTDNLQFNRNAAGNWEQSANNQNIKNINSKWNDGSGCFNTNRDKYYYTSCQSDGYCNLYVSSLKNAHWQKPVLLNENVNLPKTNTKHPAISQTGDTLFFVSDRAGGYGNLDIWRSIRGGDGQWMAAENLGKEINTPFNEVTPFYISQEHLFIFASDGHGGMGGMDLYWVEMIEEGNTEVSNMGAPFNSSKDDCYLVVGNHTGLLASNRYQSFDIYGFDKPEYLTFKDFLLSKSDIATYSSAEPFQNMITDAGINFPYEDQSYISVKSSQTERLRNGSTRYILNSDVDDIKLEKFRRESQREEEERKVQEPLPMVSVLSQKDSMGISTLLGYPIFAIQTKTLSPPAMGEVKGYLYDILGDSTLSQVTLNLTNEQGSIVKITTTNQAGEFRFVNLEADKIYHIMIASNKVLAGTRIKVKDMVLRPLDGDINTVKYESIYFDFNRSALRNESRKVLQELADFWLKFPELQIEINAFTDSIGEASYNLQLSQERGQSALDYLISLGVDPSALVIDARGISTDIYAENPFVSQQLNRRVEFEVIGRRITYQPEYETRILKPKVDLYNLADMLHMNKHELMQANGLQNEELQPYRPVRVKIIEDPKADVLFYDIIKR